MKFLISILILFTLNARAAYVQSEMDIIIHNSNHRNNVVALAKEMVIEIMTYYGEYAQILKGIGMKPVQGEELAKLLEKVEAVVELHDIEKMVRSNVKEIHKSWGLNYMTMTEIEAEVANKLRDRLNEHGEKLISRRSKEITLTREEKFLIEIAEKLADWVDRYKNPISVEEFGRAMINPIEWLAGENNVQTVGVFLKTHDPRNKLLKFLLNEYPLVTNHFSHHKSAILTQLGVLRIVGIDHEVLDPIDKVNFALAIPDYGRDLLHQIFTHAHTEFYTAAKKSIEGRMVFFHGLYKYRKQLIIKKNEKKLALVKSFITRKARSYFRLFDEIDRIGIVCK